MSDAAEIQELRRRVNSVSELTATVAAQIEAIVEDVVLLREADEKLRKRQAKLERAIMEQAPKMQAMTDSFDKMTKELETARVDKSAESSDLTTTEWLKANCPAVVHLDGTARPQIVDKKTNPRFHRLIEEFHKLTGLPVLVNTRFNMHEEPIVCTPEDAVRAFLDGRLDILAINDFLVEQPSEMSE